MTKAFEECMTEIDRILKIKNNTFENHYKEFDKKYGELIFNYLQVKLSISPAVEESKKKSDEDDEDYAAMRESTINRRKTNQLRFTLSNELVGVIITSVYKL